MALSPLFVCQAALYPAEQVSFDGKWAKAALASAGRSPPSDGLAQSFQKPFELCHAFAEIGLAALHGSDPFAHP